MAEEATREPKKEDVAQNVTPIVTRDRHILLTLRALDHVALKIESRMVGSSSVLVYTFPETAWTDYDRYMRGEAIPIDNIRKVWQVEDEFKNNLKRFSH